MTDEYSESLCKFCLGLKMDNNYNELVDYLHKQIIERWETERNQDERERLWIKRQVISWIDDEITAFANRVR